MMMTMLTDSCAAYFNTPLFLSVHSSKTSTAILDGERPTLTKTLTQPVCLQNISLIYLYLFKMVVFSYCYLAFLMLVAVNVDFPCCCYWASVHWQ